MKFLLAFLSVLLFSSAAEISYDTSVNYISNPDFSIPKLTTINVYTETAGAWSEVNNQIEIGKGSLFNSRWDPNIQICELGADTNSNVYQLINLDAGRYQLNIIWAAKQNQTFPTSEWSVYWNDFLVKYFIPVDYEIHKQTLIIRAIQGVNKLSLRGEGTSDIFGAGIKLVELYGQNNIKNGGFEAPVISGDWIMYQSAKQWSSNIKSIEIGKGNFYNPVWKTGQISQLDTFKNTQIHQHVFIPAGKYQLKFDWAARIGIPLESNAFSVYWNGLKLDLTTAKDYSLHTYTRKVEAREGKNILSLRGEGTSDHFGVGVDNVRLWRAV